MNLQNDPLGQAILDFSTQEFDTNIIVSSDLCDDDELPVPLLFRSFEEMPEIEQKALMLSKGRTLDIGAAAGCHSSWLKEKGIDVIACDTSIGAIEHMKTKGINTFHGRIEDFEGEKFDTLLLLMNGAGMCGKKSRLTSFYQHLTTLLNSGGQIICDSSDLSYLYEEEDGSTWIDLNSEYYGEIKFNMKYKNHESGWFDWLYVDFETLASELNKIDLNCEKIMENDNNHYLARITVR